MPPFAHYEFYNAGADRYFENELVTAVNPKGDPNITTKHFPEIDYSEKMNLTVIDNETMLFGLIVFAIIQILMIGLAIRLKTRNSYW